MDAAIPQEHDWPARSWALALAGAVIGFLIHLLTDTKGTADVSGRFGLAAFLLTGGIAAAFAVERGRIRSSLVFALVAATTVGLAVWSNWGAESSNWETWRIACAATAVAIAAPLFLAWRDGGSAWPVRPAMLDYPNIHNRAWTGVVLAAACAVFALLSFLLATLLASLFGLIGIKAVSDLVYEQGFVMTLFGGAFGGAAGVMRDREQILVTLQSVVRKVLSVMGPVLGVGLAVFIIALPFTGLAPLWDATRATTPILITVIISTLTLINAAIGDSSADEAKSHLLTWGTILLGGAMLPLGLIAAVSTNLRITQYGITPDRLWAAVFVGIACAYGVAYLYALVIKRGSWWAEVRRLNVLLALGLCLLALLLASPLASFGGWSTRSQLARLESGKVTPERFDWTAMRFDFGKPGINALERLAANSAQPAVKSAAANVLKMQTRWEAGPFNTEKNALLESLDKRLRVLPVKRDLPEGLRKMLAEYSGCGESDPCVVHYTGGAEAVMVREEDRYNGEVETAQFIIDNGRWERRAWIPPAGESAEANEARIKLQRKALPAGKIEVREVKMRKVFIEGQPAGLAFD